ncbi:MAG TPA: T9SS type A sorting domain-containing protein [Bacteroidia bacterium]
MKKQLFTLSIIFACFFKSNAQSFQLIDTTGFGNTSTNLAQPTYTFTVDTNAAYSFMFKVKNVTSSSISIKVKKYIISNPSNDGITFCIGTNCYTPTTTLSAVVSIAANSSLVGGFLTDFAAASTPNTSRVIYTVFNINTSSDSISLTINYNVSAAAGINQITGINNQITVCPNPASSEVFFAHDLKNVSQPVSVKIYNMLGTLVKTVALETYTNSTKIDINSLEEGVYIYSVLIDGKLIKTSRLIVSR